MSFKDIVNDVLRAGLDTFGTARQRPQPFQTKGFSLGPSLVGSLDNVEEVLSYVEYFRTDLLDTLRRRIEQAIEDDRMSLEESAALAKRFEAGLASYTYLITPDRVEPTH